MTRATKRRTWSDLTFTDQFCGAGGSTIGAKAIGLRGVIALNHWRLAIETHNTNHPEIAHDCTDIQACDPRRYPSTDILITSPECTNHSLAKGRKRKGLGQEHLFDKPPDPSDERSRATMWDVPRFAEYHDYRIIIVENVVDARYWQLFDVWLAAMHALGYDHQCVYLNSMFCWPTPQSRDRLYVVFHKRGNPAPDLRITPPAWCVRCERQVEAVQAWKNGRTAGRYRRQYLYACPGCGQVVEPYYYAALNAIDWTIRADRIGDRKRPLKQRTLDRIAYGLDKYGRTPLMVTTIMTNGMAGRVRPLTDAGFAQPGCNAYGMVAPFLLETAHSDSPEPRTRSMTRELSTQTSQPSLAMVAPWFMHIHRGFDQAPGARVRSTGDRPLDTQTGDSDFAIAGHPFFITAGSRETGPQSAGGAIPTLTGSDRFGLVTPEALTPFLAMLRGTGKAESVADALECFTAGGCHHGLVQGTAVVNLRDMVKAGQLVTGLEAGLPTQVASVQTGLASATPFLTTYRRTGESSGLDEPMRTQAAAEQHALVQPELPALEDCYFRMLQPHEIGRGMAFPTTYQVLGTSRDKVKQYGNAVTPPAMHILLERAVQSLTGERTT